MTTRSSVGGIISVGGDSDSNLLVSRVVDTVEPLEEGKPI